LLVKAFFFIRDSLPCCREGAKLHDFPCPVNSLFKEFLFNGCSHFHLPISTLKRHFKMGFIRFLSPREPGAGKASQLAFSIFFLVWNNTKIADKSISS